MPIDDSRELSVSEISAILKSTDDSRLEAVARKWADDPRPGVITALESARGRVARFKAERSRLRQLYLMEDTLRDTGIMLVAGIDEVGRGALAGPLTAAACILPPAPRISGLDDSKRLTPQRREELDGRIREIATCYAVAHVPPEEIDGLGVTAALRLAMTQAIAQLPQQPQQVLIDGRPMGISARETAIVKGDQIVAAIAAASIIAKVARDRLMCELADIHGCYSFHINKGYGTQEHIEAINTHGLCAIHRRSFCRGITDPRLF